MKPINLRLIALLFIVLAIIASVILIREFRQQNMSHVKQAPNQEAEVHLAFAYYGGVSYGEMKELVDRYNQTNVDEVKVELLEIPKTEYMRVLNMQMIAGTGPDVLSVDPNWKTTYFYKNWLADVKLELQAPGMPAYNEWALQYGSFNGETFSVPHAFNTVRLIYNKKLFLAAGLDPLTPPTTLEELSDFAKRISDSQVGYQRYGFAWPLGDPDVGFVQSMEVPLTYSGLSVFNYRTGQYDLSGYNPWMETMIELKHKEGILPGELSLGYSAALAQFAKGNVGMMILSSSDVYKLEHELDISFDWGVAMPPALDKAHIGKSPLMLVPEPMIGVNNASLHKEQAMKFWRYLESAETLKGLYRKQVLLPYSHAVRTEVLNGQGRDPRSNFNLFYPTKQEAFYPPLPTVLNNKLSPGQAFFLDINWNNRLRAYTEAISSRIKVQDALRLETKRLNYLLQTEIQNGHIDIHSYVNAKFASPFED